MWGGVWKGGGCILLTSNNDVSDGMLSLFHHSLSLFQFYLDMRTFFTIIVSNKYCSNNECGA